LQASYLTTSTVSTANGAEKIAIQLLTPDILLLLLLCLLLLFCSATRKIQPDDFFVLTTFLQLIASLLTSSMYKLQMEH
jgi:Ca2+/Na+ antiporter